MEVSNRIFNFLSKIRTKLLSSMLWERIVKDELEQKNLFIECQCSLVFELL